MPHAHFTVQTENVVFPPSQDIWLLFVGFFIIITFLSLFSLSVLLFFSFPFSLFSPCPQRNNLIQLQISLVYTCKNS